MNIDVWARWLTWLGMLIALVSLVLGIALQADLNTGSDFGGSTFETTQRLIYATYSLVPLAVGVAVVALGRILAVLTARSAGEGPSTTLDRV